MAQDTRSPSQGIYIVRISMATSQEQFRLVTVYNELASWKSSNISDKNTTQQIELPTNKCHHKIPKCVYGMFLFYFHSPSDHYFISLILLAYRLINLSN